MRDGWITIVAPLPGGPALDAGIQTGDRVVTVDGKPMHGVRLDEAQKPLRGKPGSTVRLTIERPGVSAPIEFALTRREIHVRSVQHAMLLCDGVGLRRAVDLQPGVGRGPPGRDRFAASGRDEIVCIFDLRADPGGLARPGRRRSPISSSIRGSAS